MGRLDLPDKYRDEDATERRRLSRRLFNTLTGRRTSDLKKPRKVRGGYQGSAPKGPIKVPTSKGANQDQSS